MSRIPAEFTAGDTVEWIETAVPDDATAATAYLRANVAQGASLSGVQEADGWRFTLAGNVSATFTPSSAWRAQVIAVVDGANCAVSTYGFTVLPSLAFTGNPTAIDLRSQAARDLEQVDAAIRALVSGAQEYRIGFGNQGRTVRRADLEQLIIWRDRLRAEVAAEERKLSGNTDRGIYVRFTPWA